MEEEGSYEKSPRPDVVPDEDVHYESEEENIEVKAKEKPVGPPVALEIPLRPPPARPEKVLSSLSCHLICQVFSLKGIWRSLNWMYINLLMIYVWKVILDSLLVST